MTQDEKYMKQAIKQAKKAYALDEVPIGCVIVAGDKIIARGYNRRNTDKNPLAHAELSAIRKASKKTGDWRLEECTMYVTLELSDVCRGNSTGTHSQSGNRCHESESRLCRFNHQSTADAAVQPSGADRYRHLRRRMQHYAFYLFQGAAKEAQASRGVNKLWLKPQRKARKPRVPDAHTYSCRGA